jgi:hypothetical protein
MTLFPASYQTLLVQKIFFLIADNKFLWLLRDINNGRKKKKFFDFLINNKVFVFKNVQIKNYSSVRNILTITTT